MDWKGKVLLVTGGAGGIGRRLAEGFSQAGAMVAVMDKRDADTRCDDFFRGDLSSGRDIEAFVSRCLARYTRLDGLINNAMESRGGYPDCGWEDFLAAQAVGVAAPYYLAKLLAPHFNPGASILNIASTRAFQSQRGTESYSAAKGGILALTHALAQSLAGVARVNAIAPGWIDTSGKGWSEADRKQHPVGRVGEPEDILQAAFYLMGDGAGFVTGQCLLVDGGMGSRMVYHGDEGWRYIPEGASRH